MPIFSAVILAAGSSSRMGEAKQLLPINGQHFIQHINNTAKSVFGNEVFIILGSEAVTIMNTIPELAGQVFINGQWQQGMGTSISFGVSKVLETNPAIDGILFLTADQPFITSSILSNMVALAVAQPDNIVATDYDGTAGIPALFTKVFFDQLLQLNGEHGARKIISAAAGRVQLVNIGKAAIDIDTPEQYRSIIGNR